jgi:hypothetical protein
VVGLEMEADNIFGPIVLKKFSVQVDPVGRASRVEQPRYIWYN